MNSNKLLLLSVFVALMLAGCGDARVVEGPFSDATNEANETEAIDKLISKCDTSGGRFTFACHCTDEAGDVLYFEPAVAAAGAGETVHVAIRLLKEGGFGPEDITVCTVWHTVVSAENLNRLLAKARTFYDIGHPLPKRP